MANAMKAILRMCGLFLAYALGSVSFAEECIVDIDEIKGFSIEAQSLDEEIIWDGLDFREPNLYEIRNAIRCSFDMQLKEVKFTNQIFESSSWDEFRDLKNELLLLRAELARLKSELEEKEKIIQNFSKKLEKE